MTAHANDVAADDGDDDDILPPPKKSVMWRRLTVRLFAVFNFYSSRATLLS